MRVRVTIAAAAALAATSAGAQAPYVPQWAERPSYEDVITAYPIEAAARNRTGRVVFRCRLSETMQPVDCYVESETPQGHGFAEAGRALVAKYRLEPVLPVGAEIRAPIRFELETGPEPRERVDECAGYALAAREVRKLDPVADWWARYWVARSEVMAQAAGETDVDRRLAASKAHAAERLAAGKERGWFGKLSWCELL